VPIETIDPNTGYVATSAVPAVPPASILVESVTARGAQRDRSARQLTALPRGFGRRDA
jgi:hypothetical protein